MITTTARAAPRGFCRPSQHQPEGERHASPSRRGRSAPRTLGRAPTRATAAVRVSRGREHRRGDRWSRPGGRPTCQCHDSEVRRRRGRSSRTAGLRQKRRPRPHCALRSRERRTTKSPFSTKWHQSRMPFPQKRMFRSSSNNTSGSWLNYVGEHVAVSLPSPVDSHDGPDNRAGLVSDRWQGRTLRRL